MGYYYDFVLWVVCVLLGWDESWMAFYVVMLVLCIVEIFVMKDICYWDIFYGRNFLLDVKGCVRLLIYLDIICAWDMCYLGYYGSWMSLGADYYGERIMDIRSSLD